MKYKVDLKKVNEIPVGPKNRDYGDPKLYALLEKKGLYFSPAPKKISDLVKRLSK